MPENPVDRPFRIGIRPLSPNRWLEVDARLKSRQQQKMQLYKQAFTTVYASIEGMRDSESELLAMVHGWLNTHAPEALTFENHHVANPALAQACLLINEDVAIMRRTDDGWVLAAACICFPSLWSLREKIGRVLAEVHAPVPGFQMGTRHAAIIERMFDKLRVGEPVERFNYSIHDHDTLHLPGNRKAAVMSLDDALQTHRFLRGERQTLTRMPHSNDIVFTIDTTHVRLGEMTDSQRQTIREQLSALSDDELTYKGLRRNTP